MQLLPPLSVIIHTPPSFLTRLSLQPQIAPPPFFFNKSSKENPYTRSSPIYKARYFLARSTLLSSSSFKRDPYLPPSTKFKIPESCSCFLGSISPSPKLPYTNVSIFLQTTFKTINVCLVFQNRFRSFKNSTMSICVLSVIGFVCIHLSLGWVQGSCRRKNQGRRSTVQVYPRDPPLKDFLELGKEEEEKAGFVLIGPRRGEGRFCAFWEFSYRGDSGMGETLGSKSVFRVLFVFRCVCVVDVLNCCCVLLISLMVIMCC